MIHHDGCWYSYLVPNGTMSYVRINLLTNYTGASKTTNIQPDISMCTLSPVFQMASLGNLLKSSCKGICMSNRMAIPMVFQWFSMVFQWFMVKDVVTQPPAIIAGGILCTQYSTHLGMVNIPPWDGFCCFTHILSAKNVMFSQNERICAKHSLWHSQDSYVYIIHRRLLCLFSSSQTRGPEFNWIQTVENGSAGDEGGCNEAA